MIIALIIVFVVVIPALSFAGEVSDTQSSWNKVNELDVG